MTYSFLDLEKIAEAKPANLDHVVEAVRTFQQGMTGGFAARARLQEAFTTSDFPKLLGRGLEVELLDRFQQIDPDWKGIADEITVSDFKPKKLVDLFGIDDFEDVAQGEEYKSKPLAETEYEVQVGKTGLTVLHSWELNLNQDWDAIHHLPERLANAARRTEDKKVFGALLDPKGGPSKSLFTGASAATNTPLTAGTLQEALESLATRETYDGELADVSKMVLVVHPALQFQANRIVNAQNIEVTDGNTKTLEPNPFRGMVNVVAPRALAKYDKGKNAATTWFLLPAPGSTNPALAKAKLQGHENPDIRVKNDQGLAVGGGSINPEEGSFGDDTIAYRGRHVTGAAALMPYAVFASTGV